MPEQDAQTALRDAFQRFSDELESLKREHAAEMNEILRQIDELKIKEVRKQLGIS